MRIAIVNGNVITGDGKTVLEKASVIIQDELIMDTIGQRWVFDYTVDKIIDAKDNYVIPGIINNHTHGVTTGPLFPSGSKPLPRKRVIANLNKHMLQGTTTLLSCDGFATMGEVELINKLHPVTVKTGTTHAPSNFKAADLCDGSGLAQKHRELTVEEMLSLGAVAIAEVGSGATFGGGAQDYYYIPTAVKKKTGRNINSEQARTLKVSVLSRYVTQEAYNPVKVSEALKKIELADILTVEEAKKLIMETTLPSVDAAKDGVREAGALALKFNVPMIVHNAAASKEVVYEVAKKIGPKMIAGHSNHDSLELDEAVEHARRLKECGAIVDVASEDAPGEDAPTGFALVEEGLVDIISTDFMGGYWKSILLFMEKVVKKSLIDLPQSIAMGTGNVTKAIPRLAPYRGIIAPNKIADIVVVNRDHISTIDTVITGGVVTIEDGKLIAMAGD